MSSDNPNNQYPVSPAKIGSQDGFRLQAQINEIHITPASCPD